MIRMTLYLLILLFITGCSTMTVDEKQNSSVKTTNKCTIVNENVSVEWAFTTKDKIHVAKSIQKTSINKDGLDELGIDVIKQQINNFEKEYNERGVDYNVELSSDLMLETLIVDYELAELQKLVDMGFIIPDKNGDLSIPELKKTIELFKTQGYNCDVQD